MKRGLVTLDTSEIPEEEWAARLGAVQDRLRREGLSAALVYGDVHRSDDIAYLTNLCIYWNEGILAVPAEGEPAFLTKLSKRVHPWMRRSSVLSDLRSGRSLGALVAGFLDGEDGPGAVGIVDDGWWPAMLLDEVAAALPGWELRPLPDAVRDARAVPSANELALLERAGAVLWEAVAAAVADGHDDRERVALVERMARGNGFKDLRVRCERTGGAVSVDAVGEYRNGWVEAARADGADRAATLGAALEAAAARLGPGVRPSALSVPDGVRLRCIDQADLSTEGAHRPLGDADAPLAQGAVVALRVESELDGGGRLAVADTYVVRADGPTRLTEGSADGGLG